MRSPREGFGQPVRREIVETRRMNVSNLYVGALAKRPIVSIGVPVTRNGVGLYSMDIAFGPERFTITFTPPAGRIRVSVRREGAEAVIEVADTGHGISPHLVPRVFDLFAQGEQTLERSRSGLGLGLTVVRRLVEMHAGTVHAVSEGVGRGAAFTVRLPAIEPVVAPREAIAELAVTGTHRRVVLIEDNGDARDMLRMQLELEGHDVHDAGDGAAGIEKGLGVRPDVVIVDVGLPDVDGYEVARRIRRSEVGRRTTLIALTGDGQDDDRRRAEDAGFNQHLVKPATPEALRAALA